MTSFYNVDQISIIFGTQFTELIYNLTVIDFPSHLHAVATLSWKLCLVQKIWQGMSDDRVPSV